METMNLYGEDGIATYLTGDYDVCRPDDSDAAIKVIGHAIYASSAEEAEQHMRIAYLIAKGIADPLA